jgi:putative ABC transport system permease protein
VIKLLLTIPLAWLQLVRQRVRFAVTLSGITFIVVLMFMQLGFQEALYNSATQLHNNLQGDLFIISAQYKSLTSNQSFSRSRLYQVLGLEGIESVRPLYIQFAKLKNSQNGRKYPIYLLGFNPAESVFNLPEVQEKIKLLQIPDIVLFDRAARGEFGPIAKEFERNKSVKLEIFTYTGFVGYKIKVGGLFTQGPSFGVDGNLIVSSSTFLRIFRDRPADKIDIGIISLKPEVDPQIVLQSLSEYLPKDVKVMTKKSFIQFEKDYWAIRTPIGFVFNLMVMMSFVVGVIVVYQILHSNISNHLAEYATLKAMGFRNTYLLNVVFQQSVILANLGYLPGFIITLWLYGLARKATNLPVIMSSNNITSVLIATILMCVFSGFLSINKLRSVDPADIF